MPAGQKESHAAWLGINRRSPPKRPRVGKVHDTSGGGREQMRSPPLFLVVIHRPIIRPWRARRQGRWP
jgi:hypothetical protein